MRLRACVKDGWVFALLASLAALGTVAAAWIMAYRLPRHYSTGQFEFETPQGWVHGARSNATGMEVWTVNRGKRPKDWVLYPNVPMLAFLAPWVKAPTAPFDWCTSSATGWPFPCLALHVEMAERKPEVGNARQRWLATEANSVRPQWTGALVWNPGAADQTAFPVVPLWGPFLANWAIFTAALASPVLTLRVVRRLKRRRGHCAVCGYDRRGLAADTKCPECGTVPAPANK